MHSINCTSHMLASSLLIVSFAQTGLYLSLLLDFIAHNYGAEDLLSPVL